jgi:hypothetical protein
MRCPSCGAKIPDTARFCTDCGAPQSNQRAPARAPTRSEPVGGWHPPPPALPPHELVTPGQWEMSRRHEEYRRMSAADRSFTTPAVITLVLYLVLWLPGFIANFFYLQEANKIQRLTGRAPEGKGCLVAMWWLFGLSLLFGLCLTLGILILISENFIDPR